MLVSHVFPYFQVFWPKFCVHFSSLPFMLHALSISTTDLIALIITTTIIIIIISSSRKEYKLWSSSCNFFHLPLLGSTAGFNTEASGEFRNDRHWNRTRDCQPTTGTSSGWSEDGGGKVLRNVTLHGVAAQKTSTGLTDWLIDWLSLRHAVFLILFTDALLNTQLHSVE